jgi:hypothetical protein
LSDPSYDWGGYVAGAQPGAFPLPERPRVTWINPTNPEWPSNRLVHAAAHYDAERHELSINSAWHTYISVLHASLEFADHYGAMRHLVFGSASDEWSYPLSEIVVARRTQAYMDGLQNRLDEYLSDDALTTAAIFQGPILDRVRVRLREHGRRARRRRLERPAPASIFDRTDP